MSVRTGLARIVGTPTKSAWAQVHQYSVVDETKIALRGQLYAVFSLDLTLLPSVDVGHEIITRLNEEYYGDESRDQPFSLLRRAVETVASEFSAVKLEIATCVLWRKYVYFCICGQAGVRVYRDQKLVNILSGQEQKLAIASGQLNPQDLFFLTTSAFDKLIDTQTLTQMLGQFGDISELADNIVPLAHRASLPTLATAILSPVAYTSEPETVGEEIVREEMVSQQSPAPQVAAKNVSKGWFFKDLLVKIALKLPDREVATNTRFTPSGRKTAVSVGLLLLALFALSIGFGIKQKQEQEYRLSYSTQLTQAQSAYEESIMQKEVNSERSRELFLQAKQVADELLRRGIKDEELSDLIVKIQSETPNILGEVRQEAAVFLDLSLVRTGVSASELSLHQETLAILDRGGQRIISISSAKETLALSGPEKLKNPKSIALYAGRYFSLGDNGIVELDKKGTVVREIKSDEEWVDPVKIGAFGSNVYLLDKKGEIWRYSGTEGDFSAKQRWLAPGVTPDFSGVVDISIDGSIWTLNQDGTILRYTKGAPSLIKLSGLEKPLSGALAIYAVEDLDSFYLLDKNNSRIVELSKRGVYQKQYLASQIAETVDFVVSKKSAKIFLLTSEKVLELPL